MKAIKGSPIEEEKLKRFSQPGKYLDPKKIVKLPALMQEEELKRFSQPCKYLDPKKIVKLPVVMLQKSRSVVEEAPAST